MTLSFIALGISVVTGLLAVELPWSRDRRGLRDLALKMCLGIGLGPAISGALAFAVTLVAGFRRGAIVGADLALLAALAALAWRRRPTESPAAAEVPHEPGWTKLLLPALLLLLAVEAVAFGIVTVLLPEGGWDAWAFWNLRAKHLVELPAAQWTRVFEATPGFIGWLPDYPPLFPFLIARLWAWGATESGVVTLAVAALYTFSAVGLLVTALSRLTTRTTALLAGLTLAGTPIFFQQGAWRMADMPLAWFMLATAALIAVAESRGGKSRGLLTLAGLACGLAALTKNEGMLFFAAVASAWAVATLWKGPRGSRARDLAAFALGVALPAALLVIFKTCVAPGVGLGFVGPEGAQGALPASSPEKHLAILSAVIRMLLPTHGFSAFAWALVPLAVLLGLRVPPRTRRAALAGVAVVGVMALGYYVVYAATRFEVNWLLGTTIARLLVHLAPLAIFVVFLFLSPGPPADQPPDSARNRRPSETRKLSA